MQVHCRQLLGTQPVSVQRAGDGKAVKMRKQHFNYYFKCTKKLQHLLDSYNMIRGIEDIDICYNILMTPQDLLHRHLLHAVPPQQADGRDALEAQSQIGQEAAKEERCLRIREGIQLTFGLVLVASIFWPNSAQFYIPV